MTILLYGPDTYRSRQKLNEIIEGYKKIHKSGLNLKYFEGKELEFEDFRDEILSFSMFGEKKLLILRDVFPNQEFKEKFLKDFKKIVNPKDIILFYEEAEVLEDDNLLKLLKKSGKSQEFKFLEGRFLKNWVKKEFERYEARASIEVIEKLTDFVGNDTWRLFNEIQKLVNYKRDKEIQIKDVELLVRPKIETDIFKTIDAIAQKNKKQALGLLHKHLEKGDSPLYLLSMINFQFRNLVVVKNLMDKNYTYQNILKSTKLHPYVVKKSLWQAQKFSLTELKKIYRKIFQADIDIKTGKKEPETALDLLIAEI